jgi:hypothetical protein
VLIPTVRTQRSMSHYLYGAEFGFPNEDARPDLTDFDASPVYGVADKSILISARREAQVKEAGGLSRELAENELTRLLTTDPSLTENWIGLARIVGAGLFGTSIILAGTVLLAMAGLLVRWLTGLIRSDSWRDH